MKLSPSRILAALFLLLPQLSSADPSYFYNKALEALRDCRIDQAQSYISRLDDGDLLSRLQKKLTRQRTLQNRVDSLYSDAQAAFAQCDYAVAVERLEQAIYAPGCRRIRQQLSDKLLTVLTATENDARIERQWSGFVVDINAAEETKSVELMEASLKELSALKGKAVCSSLNKNISRFIDAKQKRYTTLEFANRPYAAVSHALKECDIPQSRRLMAALPEGERKEKLKANMAALKTLENETAETFLRVNEDYAQCHFASAVERLETLKKKQQCDAVLADLDVRLARARTDFNQDQQVVQLLEDARKSEDAEQAYAHLVKAGQLNVCQPQQEALDKLVVEKRQKLPPEKQVAATDCSAWSHGEAYWVESAQRPGCRCEAGYQPNDQKTGCVPTPARQVANLDCSTWDNSEARWFSLAREAGCFCKSGYRWRPDYTACERTEKMR